MASCSKNIDYTNEDADYDSTYEDDDDTKNAKKARRDLAEKPKKGRQAKAGISVFNTEHSAEEGRRQRYQLSKLNAYDRHKQLINTYQLYYSGATAQLKRDTSNDKRDIDVIREHHRFLWKDSDVDDSWEVQLAKRYHDKLFKEYCIIDLSRYKENKFGMRWRIEKEVVIGKGQFECANKKCCERKHLRTWEVNFGYVEMGEKKNALIKCRLCFECSYKLNYHHKKKEVTRKKKNKKKRKHNKRSRTRSRSRSRSRSSSSSEDDKNEEKKAQIEQEKTEKLEKQASEVWSQPVAREEEKSRNEVFDEFLEDLFL